MNLGQLRKALDSGEISAVELTTHYLDRIKRLDNLNSYITVCEAEAIEAAKSAQKIISSGNAMPLTGIPVSVKDNICTKGIRTTCASKMLCDFVPDYDAYAVTQLKKHGFVMIGKTNMDEFAMGNSSQNSYFGGVKNPYDLTRTPGGSSGGAAVSVCADLCAAALSSDTGGSVRLPATYCGVTGLTPTYGAVSRFGLIAFASSLDRIGVIAKSALDTGYIFDAIRGRDSQDATSVSNCGGTNPKKIGIIKEFLDCTDSEVKKHILKAADYYKSEGFEIVECSLPSLEYAVSAYYLISSAEAAANLSRYDGVRYGHRADFDGSYEELIRRSRTEGFGDEVKRRIMLGNYALSEGYYEEYYKKACMVREQIKREYSEIFKKCDVILTPTAPHTADKLDFANIIQSYRDDICTITVNMAGLCAISTTCGYDSNGLPVGMSLIGKPFDEQTIIALCDRFERDFTRKEAIL